MLEVSVQNEPNVHTFSYLLGQVHRNSRQAQQGSQRADHGHCGDRLQLEERQARVLRRPLGLMALHWGGKLVS